jgi:hypothetical protein
MTQEERDAKNAVYEAQRVARIPLATDELMAQRGTISGFTPEEFVHIAITNLWEPTYVAKDGTVKPTRGKGIHSVYSKHNALFQKDFGTTKEQTIAVVERLVREGKIESRPVAGGVKLYHVGEMVDNSLDSAMEKMLKK